MVYVQKREGETIDHLIARFRHVVQQAGILPEFKRASAFESPAERRRAKRAAADGRRAIARKSYAGSSSVSAAVTNGY